MRIKGWHAGSFAWLIAATLTASIAGCGGNGKDPILGSTGGAAPAPLVITVTPAGGSTGVAITHPVIAATFNEALMPFAGAAGFTVTCSAPCTNAVGTVTLDPTAKIATFALAASTSLSPLTLYSATVIGAVASASGVTQITPYVWQFTTAAAVAAPTVTAVAPTNSQAGVPINEAVAATFSEAMAPITGAASFKLVCAAPCANPTGTVALDAAGTSATFTPASNLAPFTVYTATITGASSRTSGLALAAPYVWVFTTGGTASITRPGVLLTVPTTTTPGPTDGVPTDSAITVAFTEAMAPSTINAGSVTVVCAAPCVSPAGTVSYQVGNQTAVFTPTAALSASTTYTVTVTTAATDLANNALGGNQAALPAASDYIWAFTTAAAGGPAPAGSVTIHSTNPTAGQTAVCPSASVNATFTVPAGLRMDPSTVDAATFSVVGPAPALTALTAASVVLDTATGTIATFTPQGAFTPSGTYTATIVGGQSGVKDLAVPGNDMLNNFTWNFTVGATSGACVAPVPLGSASPFGDFGGTAGTTNTGTLTVVNGDIGSTATATSSVTGYNDTGGDIYTQTPANIGTVNGTIFTCTHSTTGPTAAGTNASYCSVATQARLDTQTAYLALAGMPPGADPGGNLAGLTLAPGVYTAPAGSFMIQGSDLTLDAGGNANAVWVFQMATTLTVGGPGAAAPQNVILTGGAQAKNVFWQVGTAATINAGGGGTMVGTIISQAGVAFSTAGNVALVTLNGRALSLGASVTLVDTVINVPAP